MENCVLCQSSKFISIYRQKDWTVIKCGQCGLVRTERKIKPQYEQYHRDEDYQKFESLFRNIFLKRFNIVNKYFRKPGVVLEIGTSTGTMLEIFKNKGWDVWGIEPSRSGDVARRKGIRVIKSIFESAKLSSDYFDLVVINHTLEHLENPVLVLSKIKRVLKKGGLVLVDVPNFDSLKSQILGVNWPYLLPLEHNYQFTRESLEKIFKKVGLKTVFFESRSGIFDFADPFREAGESLFTFKKRFFTNLLNLPLDALSTAVNRGDAMSLVGRK
jgi:SAM-dependent methyltransferase